MLAVAVLALGPLAGRAQSGTYRVVICKGAPCSLDDTTTAVVGGYIVLSDQSIPAEAVGGDGPLRSLSLWQQPGARLDACYTLRGYRIATRTYAGGSLAGVVATQRGLGTIGMTLYNSPDAYHRASIVVTGDSIHGNGGSWGVGGGAPPESYGRDTIVGVRVGAADPARCGDGYRDKARRLERFGRGYRGLPPRIDPGFRYIVLLRDALLEPGAPLHLAVGFAIYQTYVDSTETLTPSGLLSSRAAYVDSVAAQVAALRAAGVPGHRIVLWGEGRSAAIAVAVAARVSDSVRVITIGTCDDPIPGVQTSSEIRLLEVRVAGDSTASCGTPLGSLRADRFTLAPDPRPVHLRHHDWIDAVMAWILRESVLLHRSTFERSSDVFSTPASSTAWDAGWSSPRS